MISSFLTSFGLNRLEESLYQVLLVNSAMGATELARKANISRTSVYDVLGRLIDKGLIVEIQEMNKKLFTIQPLEKVELILKEKEEGLHEALNMIAKLKESRGRDITEQPQLLVFRGTKALQEMMKDVFFYPGEMIYSYAPPQKVFQLLTPKSMDNFHKKRIESDIPIKVIWPSTELGILKKYPFLIPGVDKRREARTLDIPVAFPLGYMVYGNNVIFLSSKKEGFGFIVRSRELAETMKGQFHILWEASRDIA